MGTDSEASRYQVMHGHASTPVAAHQRILRRLFWLRVWSRASVALFRVPSELNPADPLSRVKAFTSKSAAIAEADRRLKAWELSTSPF